MTSRREEKLKRAVCECEVSKLEGVGRRRDDGVDLGGADHFRL